MTRAVLGVVMLASLLAPNAIARSLAPTSTYSYRILNAPTSSDERAIKTLGIQPRAQMLSDKLYGSLLPLLGGTAPKLNFVPTGSPLTPGNTSANVEARPGAPQGSINVDPLAVEALTNFGSIYHDSGTVAYPHEMAHLHQTAPTLADILTREGGAQAFADIVTPQAAHKAGIPFRPGNYDGSYAPFVKQMQAPPYGRDWLLAGQFGRSGAVWP